MPDVPAPIPMPEPSAPKPVAEIQVILLSDGNVNLKGPLSDFRLMMKMLGASINLAASYEARQEGGLLIQAAPAGAMHLLNGR